MSGEAVSSTAPPAASASPASLPPSFLSCQEKRAGVAAPRGTCADVACDASAASPATTAIFGVGATRNTQMPLSIIVVPVAPFGMFTLSARTQQLISSLFLLATHPFNPIPTIIISLILLLRYDLLLTTRTRHHCLATLCLKRICLFQYNLHSIDKPILPT